MHFKIMIIRLAMVIKLNYKIVVAQVCCTKCVIQSVLYKVCCTKFVVQSVLYKVYMIIKNYDAY